MTLQWLTYELFEECATEPDLLEQHYSIEKRPYQDKLRFKGLPSTVPTPTE